MAKKGSALAKITREAKRLKKLHPNKHRQWKGYQKEAAAKYKKGTIKSSSGRKKTVRKKRRAKVGQHKAVGKVARAKKRKRPVVRQVVRYSKRTSVGKRSPVRSHRMAGSSGKSVLPLVIVGGIAILAGLYLFNKQKTPQLPAGSPPLVQTSNQLRNDKANAIVQYAMAGSLAIDAIIKLVESLNKKSDSEVDNLYDYLQQGGDLNTTIFV